MGADFIEPDLVSTKDGVLVAGTRTRSAARPTSPTTPSSPSRKTTKTIDGSPITGWFTEDFTLAELKTLRAKERIPDVRQRNTLYNGRYEIPTFEEVLDLASAERKRAAGRSASTPRPSTRRTSARSACRSRSRSLRTLNAQRAQQRDAPGRSSSPSRWATCKDARPRDRRPARPAARRRPARRTTWSPPATRARTPTSSRRPGCGSVSPYADGSGRTRSRSSRATPHGLPDAADRPGPDAHRAGLKVVARITIREREPVPARGLPHRDRPQRPRRHPSARYQAFLDAGIDGFFADYTDTGGRRPRPVGGLLLGLRRRVRGRRPSPRPGSPPRRRAPAPAARDRGPAALAPIRSPSACATSPSSRAGSARCSAPSC